jgi:hypothetical protein
MRLGLIIMAALHSLQAVALSEVRQIETNGIQYDVIITKPKNIRIIYKDDQGTPLKTFRNAFDYLKKQNLEVKALMNGGIFEPGEIPSGLLIQNQKELCPLNLKNGSGNFFMKPNGVFLIANDKAFVLPSKLYAKASCIPTYAVQSGPLLLDKEKNSPFDLSPIEFEKSPQRRRHPEKRQGPAGHHLRPNHPTPEHARLRRLLPPPGLHRRPLPRWHYQSTSNRITINGCRKKNRLLCWSGRFEINFIIYNSIRSLNLL